VAPRGIRNNNAGNIRHGAKWQGLAAEQTDSAFCTFTDPVYGIRAMGKILLNYQSRYGINTVRGIIDRWAPPVENDTEAYIEHVADDLRVGIDEPIVIADNLVGLIKAIIYHENGINPYADSLIMEGARLARGGK